MKNVHTIEDLADYINSHPKDWKQKVPAWLEEKGWRNLIGSTNNVCEHDGKLLVVSGRRGANIVDCSGRIGLCRQVAAERMSRGYSYYRYSKVCGVSSQNLFKFESGLYNPSLDLLFKIIKPLGLDLVLKKVDDGAEENNIKNDNNISD